MRLRPARVPGLVHRRVVSWWLSLLLGRLWWMPRLSGKVEPIRRSSRHQPTAAPDRHGTSTTGTTGSRCSGSEERCHGLAGRSDGLLAAIGSTMGRCSKGGRCQGRNGPIKGGSRGAAVCHGHDYTY